ncbi:hypothetical protein U1Q18_051800, partial [Sarracenia purpurea var. burkii]
MADDIKRFPLSALSEHFHQRIKTKSEFYYWTFFSRCHEHVLCHELVLPTGRVEYGKPDVVMAILHAIHSYAHAFEYFWNQLDEADQITVASRVIPNWICQSMRSRFGYYNAKDEITEVEFAAIIKLVYVHKNSSENSIRVLIDIWDTASDRLRNHA